MDAELLVRLIGLDDSARPRACNVSVSGIYVEADGYPGSTGTVEKVELATLEGAHRVTLLAVVVRTVSVDDLWQGTRVAGVAFEFLVEDTREQALLRDLVRTVAGERFTRNEDLVGLAVDAQVESGGNARPARVSGLKSEAIVLETSWPLERGANVYLTVDSAHQESPLELRGVVQQTVRAEERRYRVEVRVGAKGGVAKSANSMTNAMTALLTEAVAPETPSRLKGASADLSGALERVSFSSLVSFLEFERLSGALSLEQTHGATVVYIEDGRITDVEGATSAAAARATLSRALGSPTGTFRLKLGPTAREDRFQMASSALLLDLLRRLDETSRSP